MPRWQWAAGGTVFGWGRAAVDAGLNELRAGIRCVDHYSGRGRHKMEEQHPELAEEIRALVEPHSQADPKFQTTFAYTRITAKAVHEQLAAGAAGRDRPVPAERSLYRILNRLGYRLRRCERLDCRRKIRSDRGRTRGRDE